MAIPFWRLRNDDHQVRRPSSRPLPNGRSQSVFDFTPVRGVHRVVFVLDLGSFLFPFRNQVEASVVIFPTVRAAKHVLMKASSCVARSERFAVVARPCISLEPLLNLIVAAFSSPSRSQSKTFTRQPPDPWRESRSRWRIGQAGRQPWPSCRCRKTGPPPDHQGR